MGFTEEGRKVLEKVHGVICVTSCFPLLYDVFVTYLSGRACMVRDEGQWLVNDCTEHSYEPFRVRS